MKYIILVSHGEFAQGLKNSLSMLAGDREDLLAAGLKNGKSADEFAEEFRTLTADITDDDDILLFGDLIGGSPLTTAVNVLSERGFGDHLRVIGGMNLPGVLSALLSANFMDLEQLTQTGIDEGTAALKEFVLAPADEEDDI